MLHDQGTFNVLGLRDVMDEASALKAEWERKEVLPVLEHLYHEIWVYGLAEMGSPVEAVGLPASVQNKITFTGYLDRDLPNDQNWIAPVKLDDPYILVTAGGGGDGVEIIDWVISAYEATRSITHRAIIVTGPFMQAAHQQEFQDRCQALDQVEIITFDNHIELLMEQACAIVAMGGYNTFCEILSLDKPALIVPRSVPRLEQMIRAQRAVELGLVTMLDPDGERDPMVMAMALQHLPEQNSPSAHKIEGLLEGQERVADLIRRQLEEPYVEGNQTA